MGAIRGGGWKTTASQRFLVFGVSVVFLGTLSLLHTIIRMSLLLISHKCEKLLFSRTRGVYLDVHALRLYNQRHTLPSLHCIRLFPVCTKHWVRKRARRPASNTRAIESQAWLASYVISEDQEMEKFFQSTSPRPDHTELTSAPSRPGDPSCPLSPYQKSTISRVCGQRKRSWFVNRG